MYKFNDLSLKMNPSKLRFRFKNVEFRQILCIIKTLKSSKAAGIDELPSHMVKDGTEELRNTFSYIN